MRTYIWLTIGAFVLALIFDLVKLPKQENVDVETKVGNIVGILCKFAIITWGMILLFR